MAKLNEEQIHDFISKAKNNKISTLLKEFNISRTTAYKIIQQHRSKKLNQLNERVVKFCQLQKIAGLRVGIKDTQAYAKTQLKQMNFDFKITKKWLNKLIKNYKLSINK